MSGLEVRLRLSERLAGGADSFAFGRLVFRYSYISLSNVRNYRLALQYRCP